MRVDVPTMMRAAVKGAPVVATGVLLQTTPMSAMGLVDKNIRKPDCGPEGPLGELKREHGHGRDARQDAVQAFTGQRRLETLDVE